jgi:hypothetical protein
MKIDFYRAGGERKALVNAIGEILGVKPEYKGAPTFIYQIGGFEVDKEGALIFDEGTEGEKAAMLLDSLKSRGFTFEKPENATLENTDDGDLLVIEIPKEGFNDIVLTNLKKLLESKGDLIKKALGVEELPVEETQETLRFPWFSFEADADKVKAYTHFITALCEMAKNQKRITATAKEVDNEKYAFRCFLLRLGFIGEEYKTARKILLSKLSGSSAFKSGTGKHEEVDGK